MELQLMHCPSIVFRPLRINDLYILEQIHAALFPIRYEAEFFLNVVNGNGIVSWGAVDIGRPDGHCDELIGFVTARTLFARESELVDMLGYGSLGPDGTFVYILTLGVVEPYRNLGIATSLVKEVIEYASSIPACLGVYLHVIAYNNPAIRFYKKMSFKCIRRLTGFYYIKGRHYDSYLFAYYVNGGRSPFSPLDLVVVVTTYMRTLFTSVISRLWRKNVIRVPGMRWNERDCSSLLSSHDKKTNFVEG